MMDTFDIIFYGILLLFLVNLLFDKYLNKNFDADKTFLGFIVLKNWLILILFMAIVRIEHISTETPDTFFIIMVVAVTLILLLFYIWKRRKLGGKSDREEV